MKKHIKILYFASLREQLEQEEETLELPDNLQTIGELRTLLEQRGNLWNAIFNDKQRLMMSVNQQMARADTMLNDGDEIAFFPPVTGG